MNMSFFEKTALAVPDAIFGLVDAYKEDSRPEKVSFLVGFYRSESGITPLMQAVKKAERRILEKASSREYLPIEGDREYLKKIGKLIFGNVLDSKEEHLIAVQTVGGTGALRLAGEFCYREVGEKLCLSEPTWPNHIGIFSHTGFVPRLYPYYDYQKRILDFDRLIHSLATLPERTIVLIQVSCHNPTGMDFTLEQWKMLSDLFAKRRLFPLFDMAYQGLAEDLETDAQGIRLFAKNGHEMAIAYSCAKNFSLYGERVGALLLIAQSAKLKENILSQFRVLIRTNYSNPPRHGAAIVNEILTDPNLMKVWVEELENMRLRMEKMRMGLYHALRERISFVDWSFLLRARGLFCCTGLSKQAVHKLAADFSIYMPSDGRINITALSNANLFYVTNAIAKCIEIK